MISASRTTESTGAASNALVPPAETVRACTDRQRRLTEYIRGHTGENIAVRLTRFVPTACVMPTSEETLVESDNADLSSDEAQQLANSVDADYLVLISTAPATIDRLPIDDQLTADRAQQFGYALHELGHIRYTAIAASASTINDRVDEGYRDFVQGLWNSCEDAAIENQLAADQSQFAADRLEIINRSISTPADEFTPDQRVEFSFRDAIETALYDRGIYETGVCERLCDTGDDQFVFAADADRQAFAAIDDSIDELLTTILTTPSSIDRAEVLLQWWEIEIRPLLPPPDQDEDSGEQEDEDEVQGESATSDERSQDDDRQREESSTEQQREGAETSHVASDNEESASDPSRESTGDGENESEHESGEDSEAHPDPSAINTDQRQETPGSDALDYPDVGNEEDADALQQSGEDADDKSEPSSDTSEPGDSDTGSEDGETGAGSESESESESEFNSETRSFESDGQQGEGESSQEDATNSPESSTNGEENGDEPSDGGSESSAGDPTSNDSDDQQGSSEEGSGEEHGGNSTSPASAETNPWTGSGSSSQTSLGSFAQTEDQSEGSGDESPSQSDDDPVHNNEVTPPEDTTSDSHTSSDGEPDQGDRKGGDGVDGSNNEDGTDADKTSSDTTETQGDSENTSAESVGDGEPEERDQPERTDAETATTDIADQGGEAADSEHSDESSTESSHDEAVGPDTPDEEASNGERAPPDPTPAHEDSDLKTSEALDADREGARDEAERSTPDEGQLEHDLGDVADALNALEDEGGGTGAAPASLDELSIMPDTVDVATDQSTARRWEDADADAGYVADALRKALKESRQTGNRSGLTSGSFDRRRAAALARGEVTAFQVRQPGNEKQYDLVLILDRSGSMRTEISTAEDALVRFAIACEDVGINVGIIDFYNDEARLIKPFSVETQYVQPSLFSGKYVGGTPLADALGISCELLEQRRNSPLVIVVTDGKPGDAETYQDELARSYAPVCGLTLALTSSRGNVPDKVAKNERFYDRHIYVHDSDQITNRLDQFAVMFDGL
jgi:hypothetical protein